MVSSVVGGEQYCRWRAAWAACEYCIQLVSSMFTLEQYKQFVNGLGN